RQAAPDRGHRPRRRRAERHAGVGAAARRAAGARGRGLRPHAAQHARGRGQGAAGRPGAVIQEITGGIRPDGSRRGITPADVRGRFTTARRLTFVVLIAVYAVLPFTGLVLLDIPGRRFLLFGLTFNAQDAWLTTLVLLVVGGALIYATTLLGRAWCGWACPQAVFLDAVYRPLERLLTRKHAHFRGARLGLLHALYGLVSLALAAVFLRYFSTSWSWLALPIGALLYGNFAW